MRAQRPALVIPVCLRHSSNKDLYFKYNTLPIPDTRLTYTENLLFVINLFTEKIVNQTVFADYYTVH